MLLGDLLGPTAAGRALDGLAAATLGRGTGRRRSASRSSGRAAAGSVPTSSRPPRKRATGPILELKRRTAAEQHAAMSLLTAAVSVAMPEFALLGLSPSR